MRSRSRARGWALQILYAWDARGAQGSPLDTMETLQRERRISPESLPYIRRLIRCIAESRREIDAEVEACLTNWRMERLSAIDRNILRLGAAELLHFRDIPPRVSIQEAIVLAEKYGTTESPRFVNGVLDALLRAARPEAASRKGGDED